MYNAHPDIIETFILSLNPSMTTPQTATTPKSRTLLWLVGVSFVLFQFFLQLSSGVIIGNIMHDMNLTALMAGLLSSSFYFVYTSLQLPVGILFDRKNARTLLAGNAVLCSVGCFVFASSTGLCGLFVGRMLIGGGSAFAFVGLSHLLRQYFPQQQFAFMIGLSETLGFLATAVGIFGLGEFIAHWGWREFIHAAGVVGIFIACLCWTYIPNSESRRAKTLRRFFFIILPNRHVWINGLFVGLSFSIVTVFGALWAIPFLQAKLACNLQKAGLISAIFFVGTGLSCPLFGFLSHHVTSRKQLILTSNLTTAALFVMLLYIPSHNTALITSLTFMAGLCCGAYMLAYSISNELAPLHLQSTCTGFTNTLAVLSVPLLQPFVGYLLDTFNKTGSYTLGDYQMALLVIPLSLLIASVLVLYLPEKKHFT